MSAKEIWDGNGCADDKAHWSKDNGELVGRRYVRDRVASDLSRWRSLYSLERRRAAIAATVDNDEWMRRNHGCTVGSVIRDVESVLLSGPQR